MPPCPELIRHRGPRTQPPRPSAPFHHSRPSYPQLHSMQIVSLTKAGRIS